MRYHIIAFTVGFLMDLVIGDPYQLPHPIRWIGALIAGLERILRRPELNQRQLRRRGAFLVVLVILLTACAAAVLTVGAYLIHPIAGLVVEAVLTCYLLATKSLKTESMKVYDALEHGTIADARVAVSMIVGRDTQSLDERGVAKAAIETVAENTSDGIIAPMFYAAIGGPVLGFVYKAVNTMDSMVGYQNEKYLDFGRCAAKLDDGCNFLPARISAWLMIAACLFLGKNYDAGHAYHIFRRDRFKHESPNSAQTESVCAGALHLALAGPASYFGKVKDKPVIGDADRAVENEDICRANHLLYGTAWLGMLLCTGMMCLLYFGLT